MADKNRALKLFFLNSVSHLLQSNKNLNKNDAGLKNNRLTSERAG